MAIAVWLTSSNKPLLFSLFLAHLSHVVDPKVVIIDEEGVSVADKFYEIDSTMQLSCIVREVKISSPAVLWRHGNRTLNYDVYRGGIRWVLEKLS